MTEQQTATIKLALRSMRSAAGELYRATSYVNTYDALADLNDAITSVSLVFEQNIKNYHEKDNSILKEDLYDLAVKADNGGQP